MKTSDCAMLSRDTGPSGQPGLRSWAVDCQIGVSYDGVMLSSRGFNTAHGLYTMIARKSSEIWSLLAADRLALLLPQEPVSLAKADALLQQRSQQYSRLARAPRSTASDINTSTNGYDSGDENGLPWMKPPTTAPNRTAEKQKRMDMKESEQLPEAILELSSTNQGSL
ncbi:hypothetical protein BDW75DRAFT_216603 [Aspergillus navahoensis]